MEFFSGCAAVLYEFPLTPLLLLMENFIQLFFCSLILLSVMLKEAMYLSLSIPFYFGQPARRSYPEEMTTENGRESNTVLLIPAL